MLRLMGQFRILYQLQAAFSEQFSTLMSRTSSLHDYIHVWHEIVRGFEDFKIDEQSLMEIIEQFFSIFEAHHATIRPYGDPVSVLEKLSKRPEVVNVLITDGPDYVAETRSNLIKILPYFDGLIAIRSELPDIEGQHLSDCFRADRIERMRQDVPRDHLALNVGLPEAHAKPSPIGLGLAMEFFSVPPSRTLIIGDNVAKEGMAAFNLYDAQRRHDPQAQRVRFIRALYGQQKLAEGCVRQDWNTSFVVSRKIFLLRSKCMRILHHLRTFSATSRRCSDRSINVDWHRHFDQSTAWQKP